MKVIRGGIYKVSNAWKKYNDALLDHRPVIVIQCNEEFVYGVLMGALPREAKHKNALYFECEVSGKRYISLCACDTVHKIPIRYIKDNLGYISIPTLWEICDRTQEYITFEKEMIEDSDLNVDREKSYILHAKIDDLIEGKDQILYQMDELKDINVKEFKIVRDYKESDEKEKKTIYRLKNFICIIISGLVTTIIVNITTLIISKKPGNTGISRDIRTEFTTDLLLSD